MSDAEFVTPRVDQGSERAVVSPGDDREKEAEQEAEQEDADE